MAPWRVLGFGAGLALASLLSIAVAGADHDAADRGGATWGDGGSSSREARRHAIEALQLDRMPPASRHAVERVLRSTTLYRRLPAATIACDASLLEFALEHPEAIVDVWRVLGISRLSLDPAGPAQWRLADGYGTVGTLRVVHRERRGRAGTLVLLGRGGYAGALAPRPLTGTCLLLVRHQPESPAADRRDRQTVTVDAFLDVDGVGLELVTRTLQPLIVRSAAVNLEEVGIFMATLSAAAERNPAGVVRLTERLTRTDPADRTTFAGIARAVGRHAESGDDPDRLQTELAARWLPAEELGALTR